MRSGSTHYYYYDDFTVSAIPEPAVLSLIGIFGGGMIFCRRIFGRKKSGSDAHCTSIF